VLYSAIYYLPEFTQYNAIDLAEVKTNEPVGTTWSYDFDGPYLSSSKAVYTIISKSEKLIFKNKQYSNGILVEKKITTYQNGSLQYSGKQEYTYFCGLGYTSIKTTDNNSGIVSTSTLSDYQY
jgi:hypothetical protein